MRIKKMYVIVLFQVAALYTWGQGGADDILLRGTPPPEKKGVTMEVDTDLSPGGGGQNTSQDSIEQLTEKWKSYLSEKNNEINDLFSEIQEMDTTITKEQIDEYRILVNLLKKDVDKKSASWQDIDELGKMNTAFDLTCEKALLKLNQWEDKLNNKKEPMNPLLIIGICLLAVMAVVPIFTQIKSSIVVKRVKKEQERLAKKQKEELEKQMLLSDENNIITLKPKV